MKKTHITFRCNLDSRAVTKYLSIMQYVRLVEKSKQDSSFYVISQKGIEYRNQFQSFMSVMEKDMEDYLNNKADSKEILADLKMRIRS